MRAPSPTLIAIAQNILGLLPTDGAPVLNRVMRAMLSRALQSEIDAETYFAARDLLFSQGKIGRLRGQGGQLFLVQEAPRLVETPVTDTPPQRWTEALLMKPLRLFLEGP